MDQQMETNFWRNYMNMIRHSKSFLTRDRITGKTEIKDDINIPNRINEQTRCSPQSLNLVQTSQSVQPNQQSPSGSNLFIQHRVVETNANATGQCFPIDNHLSSKVKALITPLLNSTPDQLDPRIRTFPLHNPNHSKDWHQLFPQDLRRHFIQRLITPQVNLYQPKSIKYLVKCAGKYEGRVYEAANSKEEYYQLNAEKIFYLQKYWGKCKRKEMQDLEEMETSYNLKGPESEPVLVTPTEKSKRSLRERFAGSLRMMFLIRKEAALLDQLKQAFFEELKLLQQKNYSSLSEEEVKKIQASKERLEMQIKNVSNHLSQMKKMLANTSNFVTRQTPSEVADSIRNCDYIEERRYHTREEVTANRRNNQLKAANLNRGLVMDVDDQGPSRSDCTFDLTTLHKSLPPVSNNKRAPRITRALKLQDIVMNSMKENRLYRLTSLQLTSMGTTSAEENS